MFARQRLGDAMSGLIFIQVVGVQARDDQLAITEGGQARAIVFSEYVSLDEEAAPILAYEAVGEQAAGSARDGDGAEFHDSPPLIRVAWIG